MMYHMFAHTTDRDFIDVWRERAMLICTSQACRLPWGTAYTHSLYLTDKESKLSNSSGDHQAQGPMLHLVGMQLHLMVSDAVV